MPSICLQLKFRHYVLFRKSVFFKYFILTLEYFAGTEQKNLLILIIEEWNYFSESDFYVHVYFYFGKGIACGRNNVVLWSLYLVV